MNLALYKFTDTSTQVLGYTNLKEASDVGTVQTEILSLSLSGTTGPTLWVPPLTQIHNERPSATTPDVVLFFVHNHPSDDLSAATAAANTLKAGGETRIVVIDTDHVDVTKLQAISGPLIGQDYYVSGSPSTVNLTLTQVCSHLCCESHKDLCGVCYGDSSLCADCAGIPNGHTQYDVCGVCGGNGTECPPVDCKEEATITVKEKTALDILAHTDTGKFEFKFNTCYQPGTAVVVSFDPYEECHLRERGTCDNRLSSTQDGWCDLFTIDYPDESVWKRTVNETALNVLYCANFSLYELLDCKDFDGYGPLVDTIDAWKHYKGTLYGTVVRPNDCYNESACETVTVGTHYDFELWVTNKGVLSSSITTRPVDFHGKWNRNIWLRSGDIIVEFCTYIESKHGDTILWDPQIIRGEETGIPFHIVNGTNCTGTNISPDTICKQTWQIRTTDAHGVLDFSGIKPIQYAVYVNGVPKFQVLLTLDLKIMRTRDPVIAYLTPDAWFGLYRDDDRTKLVAPMDTFIDCTHVFAKVALHNSTLPLHVDRILICAGSNGGDPVPFDHAHPDTTGCKTPGIDIVVYTLYDKLLNFTNDAFGFEFDRDGDVWESFWKFEAKAISEGKQLVEVHWSSDGFVKDHHGHHLHGPLPYGQLVSGRASFIPKQYNKQLYLPKEAAAPTINVQAYDDDDHHHHDDHDDHSTPHGGYSTGKTLHVVCPDYQVYSDGHCVDRRWNDLYYNIWIWGLVILIPQFICIIWACCFWGDYGYGYHHAHPGKPAYGGHGIVHHDGVPVAHGGNRTQTSPCTPSPSPGTAATVRLWHACCSSWWKWRTPASIHLRIYLLDAM